jgi:hypothetical protein
MGENEEEFKSEREKKRGRGETGGGRWHGWARVGSEGSIRKREEIIPTTAREIKSPIH